MLKREQDRLFGLLPRCLVRISRTDDCMWVCDLPRRTADTRETEERLRQAGFACVLDEKTRMWQVDWTEEKLEELLADYPEACASFPSEERYHPAYALCRLWLKHAGERTRDNLPLLRRMIKLTQEKEEILLRAIPEMHGEAALHLRTGIPSAHDAGRVLAKWLNERSKPE